MAVFIVDNDVLYVKLITFLLEEAGYTVIKASNGRDAVRLVEQHDPELVILDTCLPDMSGFDVCGQIRRNSGVPIIFLSARSEVQDRVRGLQLGADDYIVKPFEPADFLARIGAVQRRHGNELFAPIARLHQGAVTLNPVDHTVVIGDERTITLTPVELRLLYYLMLNAGRVLSAHQILDSVWGNEGLGGRNLVAVYMRRLRAKLETDADHPRYLVTVPNLGYRFAC